ncbi:MAG: TauD/TfdA family dioxygenase [Actinobacteria bacterium]|nr:TauD/TfdA family dioxygenase [Actinomycetota bacterium]
MRRRAVGPTELVKTGFIEGRGEKMPLVITPAVDNVDLAAWCASNRGRVDSYLNRYGAILFRAFPLQTAKEFETVAVSIADDLFADYGDLPQESASERVYGVTPYPADKMILFHNESSHLSSWPQHQFFFCITPSETRGETPLIDCREVCEVLDPEIVEEFARKDLMYVRNFSEGIDVPWQDFFHTSDRSEVEKICAKAGMGCEWTDNGLRISQVAKGVRNHPQTGERIFFNQVQLHHISCLDDETRVALRQLFSDEDLPRNVYYGDGSLIPDEVIARISEVYEDICFETPWQSGDLIALDNMLVSHARRPYGGARRVLVAMGDMVHASDLAADAA